MKLSRMVGLSTPTGRRRWRRIVLGTFVTLLVLVCASPYLISHTPLRNWLLSLALSKVHATGSIDKLSLAWFSPVSVHGIQMSTTAPPEVLDIPDVRMNRSLWQILFGGPDLGRIEVDRPTVRLTLVKDGSNWKDLFKPSPEDPNSPGKPRPFERKLTVAIQDASFKWKTPESTQEWTVGGIQATLGLAPDAQGAAELTVKPGTIVDHAELTPGMCNDLLKFTHPLFAGVTRANGKISLACDDCRLGLTNLKGSRAKARLTLHTVAIGAGPLVHEIVTLLGIPGEIELTHEDTIVFEMREGRIYHQDLAFKLPGVEVTTSGWVGFDQNLEIMAQVRLSLADPNSAERPVLRALGKQGLQIPIKGTINKPRIDLRGMGANGVAFALGTLDNLDGEMDPAVSSVAESAVGLVDQWLKKRRAQDTAGAGEPGSKPGSDDSQAADGDQDAKSQDAKGELADAALGVLDQWLSKRRAAKAGKQPAGEGTAESTDDEDAADESAREATQAPGADENSGAGAKPDSKADVGELAVGLLERLMAQRRAKARRESERRSKRDETDVSPETPPTENDSGPDLELPSESDPAAGEPAEGDGADESTAEGEPDESGQAEKSTENPKKRRPLGRLIDRWKGKKRKSSTAESEKEDSPR